MHALVLGAGQQGRVVAHALRSRGASVTLADVAPPPGGLKLDARDATAVRDAARGRDVVVTTLPASIGTVALPALIETRVPVVDVSFALELPFHLDEAAKSAGVPVLVDFGIAPGLSHVLAGAMRRDVGELRALRILVGGFPLTPPPVFRHAVYFNARDLVDEYLRPARMRRAGKDEAPDPLAASSRWVDEDAGPLEAFTSDGLRSLLSSFADVPDMIEETLRAPGHLDAMRDLRAMGLLDEPAAETTARALERTFPGAAFPDRVVMEVQAEDARGASRAFRVHALRAGDLTAMSRATAFTAAAGAIVLAERAFAAPGVHAPERIGADAGATKRLLDELAMLGIAVEPRSALRRLE